MLSTTQKLTDFIINKAAALGIDRAAINHDTIISQAFDSFSLASLMIEIENDLGIEVSDDAFFDATIVTIGDLSNFISTFLSEK